MREQQVCSEANYKFAVYDLDIYAIFSSSTWPFWRKIKENRQLGRN